MDCLWRAEGQGLDGFVYRGRVAARANCAQRFLGGAFFIAGWVAGVGAPQSQ